MRIPHWQADLKPQPTDLVDAIRTRRGGKLLNLDHVLLWSEPIARGWNIFMKNVRRDLGASAKQRELAICTVALLTGAHYEYHHHAPEFLAAGGQQAELDALARATQANPREPITEIGLGPIERLVVQFAAQMTLDVKVNPTLFDQLKPHFNTTELVELTTTIASYNMVARILVALEVTPE